VALRAPEKETGIGMETQTDIQEITRLLSALARQGFFGSLEVKMEAGRITLVRKTENLKVGNREWNYREDRGGYRKQ